MIPRTTKNSQPIGRISHPMPPISFLPVDSDLLGVNFIKYQSGAPVAIHSGMAKHQEEVFLFAYSGCSL
jgi:hypothetical protein